jgi:hypothetical protein
MVDMLVLGTSATAWEFESPLAYKIRNNESGYKLHKHKTFPE